MSMAFICTGRYEINTSLFVSMCLVDTLYVSFVSPGCLQEPKVARVTVAGSTFANLELSFRQFFCLLRGRVLWQSHSPKSSSRRSSSSNSSSSRSSSSSSGSSSSSSIIIVARIVVVVVVVVVAAAAAAVVESE